MAGNLNKVSVWQSLRNAWKVKDIREKIVYTFLMLVLFRLVGVIPAPGINMAAIKEAGAGLTSLPLFEYMNAMTGGQLSSMTIMAMGITPYINSSIIMQLLTIAIPALERLSKSGPDGQKKISRITRYVTVVLAAIQAIGLVATIDKSYNLVSDTHHAFNLILIGFSMAGGTALAMWIGERITEKGIGNGVSLLIFAGIIENLVSGFKSYGLQAFNATSVIPWIQIFVLIIIFLAVIVVVTYVDTAVRRINVNYAKRVTGRKMYGGQNSVIPLKLLSVGVLPLIFAYSFLSFPATIIALVGGKGGFAQWWNNNMSSQSQPLYMIVAALLIVAFSYFYSAISFQPEEMAKNIQQQGGMIPNVRPGKPTEQYLSRINGRLTLFAALFLAILSVLPGVMMNVAKISLPFAASSMMIAVSVVLETKRTLDDLLVARNYETIS